jgi:serine/threonine protein kinase
MFENSDYFYLVLELMVGADLYDYFKNREFKLSEKRIREIAFSIG